MNMEGDSASNADLPRHVETEEQEGKDNYVIRRLEALDYGKGFLELLEQLSASGHVVTEEQFLDRLREVEDLGSDHLISVIEDANSGRIVASGSVFLEKKFLRACGKVGHIEDVVVDSSVRGAGRLKSLTRLQKNATSWTQGMFFGNCYWAEHILFLIACYWSISDMNQQVLLAGRVGISSCLPL